MKQLAYLVLGIIAQATLHPDENGNDGSTHAIWVLANQPAADAFTYDEVCAAIGELEFAGLVEDVSEDFCFHWRLVRPAPVAA